jgi:P4 family phage/plasmid primase-like protien
VNRRHLHAVPDAVRPYEFAARQYFKAGWSPLPLPPGEKSWPPTGYTGGKGRAAEPGKVEYWIKSKGDGNIALRMPPTLLGIDVDAYSGKDGAATLVAAEESWGSLPVTWRTTSRTDGISGIRLFRIPEGLSWPGKLPQGGGIELCRWDHRYVIVAPSIHDKTGEQYHWFAPDGTQTTGSATENGDWEFPALVELAELPSAWVTGLTSGRKWVEHEEADLDPAEVQQWILDRPDGPLCEKMQRTLDTWMSKIAAGGEDGGAHDAARDGAWAVLRDSAAGHSGVQGALRKLMLAHKEALRGRRPEKSSGEWASIKARGVLKVAAEGPTDDDDPCVMAEVSRAPSYRNRGSEGMDFTRDDIGNGRRFALDWRNEVRWVPAYKEWFIWNGKTWTSDPDDEVIRMATKTVGRMSREIEFIEDPKEKAAFGKFIRASSNDARVNAMLRHGRSNKGLTVAAERFDTDPSHLVCTNGTVLLPGEFTGGVVKRVPSVQEHLNTLSTGGDFAADAELPEWDKFLARFQPDVEVRAWLQKLSGYSLLGANPRRLMVVCLGETSTGKSTFAEAISGALGQYAGSANMTIFRDNQDEKPRPDLIRVLPMRFVYAEEASRSWHLHPDQIKRLTGGTPITARTLQAKVFVDMVPRFTPWLVTNKPPTIEGADRALKRRIMVVPFDVEIPKSEEDATYRARLGSAQGRQAILAWLVEGYRAYLDDPDAVQTMPLGAVAANAKFWREISDLDACLDEIGEAGEIDDPAYRVRPMDLYRAYQAWCTENGIPTREIWSSTKFGRELGEAIPKKSIKFDGRSAWFRVGFRLKDGWAKVYG